MDRILFRGIWDSTENFVGASFLEPVVGSSAIVGISASGDMRQFLVMEGAIATPDLIGEAISGLDGFVPGGIYAFDSGVIWVWDSLTGRAVQLEGLADTSPIAVRIGDQALAVSVVAEFGGYIAVASADRDGLSLLNDSGSGNVTEISSVTDGIKSSVTGLSDLLLLPVGEREFLITASYTETGLSCFEVQGGQLVDIDHIGQKDGLWANGFTKLLGVQVAGKTYVIAASAKSNSLHSLRVNENGVFFTADQIWDTRDTRFEGVVDMDSFHWRGRDFILVGGQDAGLSLIEVLPDGGLFHHQSIAQTANWDLGPITQIETQVLGQEAQIYLTGSQGAGVSQLSIDLTTLGERRSGTAANDTLRGDALDNLLIGGAGNDRLRGFEGDDTLIAGSGSDALSGEEGADVFVFQADGVGDKITDYELGVDRLHLAGWGRLYHHGDLGLAAVPFGARITWGDEVLDIYSADGQTILPEDWGADDFIF